MLESKFNNNQYMIILNRITKINVIAICSWCNFGSRVISGRIIVANITIIVIIVTIIIIVTKIVPIKLSGCGFGRSWCVMSGGADEDQDLG